MYTFNSKTSSYSALSKTVLILYYLNSRFQIEASKPGILGELTIEPVIKDLANIEF